MKTDNTKTNKMYTIPTLPLTIDLETKTILKQANAANKKLAALKGIVKTMPKPSILINTLSLQEAKDSSAIESIITTHDEQFINDKNISDLDSLIKMALIHHQFESIHPFSDGNGRVGRIINILYLVQQDLLDYPVLYLSRYIIAHKAEYYRLLQGVRDAAFWQEWVLFMLKAVEQTAAETIILVEAIRVLMQEFKNNLRAKLPKIYSQDLLNNLFNHPYTKIDFVMNDLSVSRLTATSYLDKLLDMGLLGKLKIGRNNFYTNNKLFDLLINAFHTDKNEQVKLIESHG